MTVQPGFDVNVFAAEPMIASRWPFAGMLADGCGLLKISIMKLVDRALLTTVEAAFPFSRIPMEMAKRTRERPLSRGFRFQPGWRSAWEDSGWSPTESFIHSRHKDGDDKADVDEIEVRLTGWCIRDRHETLNSFIWGPDGWLYGLQGFATPSRVGKPKGRGLVLFGKSEYPSELNLMANQSISTAAYGDIIPPKNALKSFRTDLVTPGELTTMPRGNCLSRLV